MKKEMFTKTVLVTPELAQKWLKYNTSNRKISHRAAKRFAEIIKAGGYVLTHQGIAFTGSEERPGRLLDGQHRLLGIILAGIAILMRVTWGCEEGSFFGMDGTVKGPRSIADLTGEDSYSQESVNQLASLLSKDRLRVDQVMPLNAVFLDFAKMLTKTSKRTLSQAIIRSAWILRMAEQPDRAENLASLYELWVARDYANLPDHLIKAVAKLDNGFNRADGREVQKLKFALIYKSLEPDRVKRVVLNDPPEIIAEASSSIRKLAGLQDGASADD